MTNDDIGALVFDVFGTVVDWRGSIIREGKALAKAKNVKVQWSRFADGWRAGYKPAMDRVRSGELPWMNIDQLHRMILDGLLTKFKLTGLDEVEKDHLNRVWHRLKPWPDSVKGLKRLKKRYPIATLSNGNVSLLMHMARNAGLPWDCIISAELFRHYKPDSEAYLGAARLLHLRPEQVLMVAAHKDDLRAAQQSGLRTAFVARPKEKGARAADDLAPDPSFDFNAISFLDLADQLGA